MMDGIHRLDDAVRSGSDKIFASIRNASLSVAIRGSLFPFGLAMFLFPLLCIFLGAAGFLLGISLTKWHLFAALPLAGIVIHLSCGGKTGKAMVLFGLFLLANVLLLALFSLPFYDEGDGVAYHKPAAILMADGWNPVRDPENTRLFDGSIDPANANDGYSRGPVWWSPKAQWIFGAELYLATGNMDVGSCANGVYALVSFAIAYWGLSVLFRLSGFERLLAAFVIAANTTVVIQATSGMIDTQMGSLMTILLFSLASYAKTRDERFLPFIVCGIPLTCNVKTTGVVYAGIAVFLFVVPMAWTAWRKGERQDRRMLASIGAALLLTLVIGVNPYLTNTISHSNPLHPYAASGRNDPIRSEYIDPPGSIFHGTNGLQRFVVSYLLAQPATICGKPTGAFEIIPGRTFFGGYQYDLVYAEICAFGPLFAVGLAASLVLLFFMSHRYGWWILLVVAATVFVQPHSYIGRYVPQLWLVPPVVLCAIRSKSGETGSDGLRSALLFLAVFGILAAGCVIVIGGHWRSVRERTWSEMNAIKLIESNSRLSIGRASEQVGMWFCQERVARDCMALPPISRVEPRKQPGCTVVATLRYAPVYLECDPKDAKREIARLRLPPPSSLRGDIARLRFRQLRNAWGGGNAPPDPGKG